MQSNWTRERLIYRYRRFFLRASKRAGGKPRFVTSVSRFLFVLLASCSAVLLMSAQACSTTPEPPTLLSMEERAALGTVGVLSLGPAPEASVSGPVGTGRQAGRGAARGGAIGGLSGAGAGALLGLTTGPCAPLMVPVGAAVGAAGGLVIGGGAGAITGAVNAIPEEVARNVQMTLADAIADRDLQTGLRRRVSGQRAGGSANTADLGAGPAVEPPAAADYAPFAARGILTVLEISLTQVAFAGEGGDDPELALTMTARARIVRATDNAELWLDENIGFATEVRSYSEWSANPDLIAAEIENVLNDLAGQIAERVFAETAV